MIKNLSKKVFVFIIISAMLFININIALAENNSGLTQIREKSKINFIKHSYGLTEEQIKDLPDITFSSLSMQKPSGKSTITKYYSMKEDVQNVTSTISMLDTIRNNIVVEEITKEEYEQVEKTKGIVNDKINMTVSNPNITKDFGWVKLTTEIYYLPTTEEYFISNKTSYLQTAYITLSPKIDYYTGIGTNTNMSIINTSAYFNFKYTCTTPYGTFNENETRYEADHTNSDGYGFEFYVTSAPDMYYTNVQAYASVLAKANVSNLTIADAYGHFSHTYGTIDLNSSAGIHGVDLSISPTTQTTEINPIHVQWQH